ncbi:acyltransferase-domain-containing protein [Tothia fuscella]|uniref:Acyltransferase-domain-containing protein n=1 Tax=Tothia fuscella TaxID=1048955 RepID=A0A9P4NM81_9PEZI|nr:acyltransferase-domain-containing protein [Tothia fuscella]
MPHPLADFGAGLSSKSLQNHPSGPPTHGPTSQAERAFTAASTFMSGIMAISATQFLGAPLKMIDPKFYEAYMAFTKQSFGVLITTMTQWWSPTVVRVSGDKSIPKQLFKKGDGTLECRFPKRIVMMANHQLYTDWLYLWWVAYTNNMHGYIYIILKESLKNIPIVGWGAQFYNFIFLSRKWETDQKQFKAHLDALNNPDDPMWLLIFPEGTNLAKGTKEKSAEWAKKTDVQDMKHQLLPRSRGLQFCLQNLKDTTEWLYDCTIGYEGIPEGQFGQDIFTMRSSMFEGRPPKSVNMHFRRFRISDIPIDNDKAFDVWLRNRWREKDYLLEHFVKFDRFPEDEKWMMKQIQAKKIERRDAKFIETQIKSNNIEEFLSIFAPLSSVMTVLFMLNGGQNPQDMLKMLGEAAQQQHQVGLLEDAASQVEPTDSLAKKKKKLPPNMYKFEEAGSITPKAAAAQRNMIQKYINAVRPMVESQINLPKEALRLSNAGKGELSVRSNQKPGALVQKVGATGGKGKSVVSDKASTIGSKQPRKLPRKGSAETLPSISSTTQTVPRHTATSVRSFTAPTSVSAVAGTKGRVVPRVVPAEKAPIKPWAASGKPSYTFKPTPESASKNEGAAAKNPPKPSESKRVNIDPAALAKMKAKSKPILKDANSIPQKGNKSVQIDPAVLAKMKAGKK